MFEAFAEMTHQYNRTSYEQLKDYVYHSSEQLMDRSDAMREAVNDPDSLRKYNAGMRSSFLEGFGAFTPEPVPLDARITRSFATELCTVESVLFRSRPGVYVTANMYIPKRVSFPGPAVLFLCGHGGDGRMDDDYQRVCYTLVKAGLIVFAVDPTGQGERSNYFDPVSGEFLVKRTVPDHDAAGVPCVATGRFLQSYFMIDEMRAVDYMLTRPEIDPKRIGVTGSSGGGTQTVAMMATDDRIAAAAPCNFVTNRREYMYQGQAQDSEQIWPGITAEGFDHANAFLLFAPRPAAILTVTCDFFPREGTLETYRAARRIYKMLGKEENIRMYTDDYTHCYTPRLAVCAAEFFSEVLAGEKVTVDNSDFVPFPCEQLYATASGNVTADLPDALTVPDEDRAYASLLRKKRLALPMQERLALAESWLRDKVTASRETVDMIPRVFPDNACVQTDGYKATSVSWWTQKRLFSFGVMIRRECDASCKGIPTVLAVWEDGTKRIAEHEAWIRSQCENGKQVFVLDVPGTGAIEQRNMILGGELKKAYGTLYTLCGDLMYNGDSMAAMHIYDVMRTVDMLKEAFGVDAGNVTVYCDGQAGVYGLAAAFLLPDVTMCCGPELLTSVERQILGQKVLSYENTLAYLIPGMLEYFDYEELIR